MQRGTEAKKRSKRKFNSHAFPRDICIYSHPPSLGMYPFIHTLLHSKYIHLFKHSFPRDISINSHTPFPFHSFLPHLFPRAISFHSYTPSQELLYIHSFTHSSIGIYPLIPPPPKSYCIVYIHSFTHSFLGIYPFIHPLNSSPS